MRAFLRFAERLDSPRDWSAKDDLHRQYDLGLQAYLKAKLAHSLEPLGLYPDARHGTSIKKGTMFPSERRLMTDVELAAQKLEDRIRKGPTKLVGPDLSEPLFAVKRFERITINVHCVVVAIRNKEERFSNDLTNRPDD